MVNRLSSIVQQSLNFLQHLVSYLTKNGQPFFIRSLRLGRVTKPIVDAFPLPQPNRAFLIRIITNCYDKIKVFAAELIRAFRFAAMLDADLFQRLNRFWMDIARGSRPCGKRPPLFRVTGVDNRFGHLRTAGVACAEKQNFSHVYFCCFQNSLLVSLISVSSPVTMNTVRSQMLVTRSAKRSRLCATHNSQLARSIVFGSAMTKVINSR